MWAKPVDCATAFGDEHADMSDRLVRYLSHDDHALAVLESTLTAAEIGVDQHGLRQRPLAVLARGVVSGDSAWDSDEGARVAHLATANRRTFPPTPG